ncbi:MAG TPA: ATP-binding protein [Ktedonobacterales bacterium]
MSLPPSSTVAQRSATRRLTRRYSLALVAIAVLGILGQIIVQVNIAQLSRDTHVIDVAALQRTLSERLSKAALAILDAPDETAQSSYASQLSSVANQWEHTHLALQRGDEAMGLPGQNSPEVTQLFEKVAPSFNYMQDAATKLLVAYYGRPPILLPETPSLANVISPYVQEILAAEPEFVVGMDAIVAQYQREADGRILRLQIIEWSLLGVEMLVLLLLVLLVFRPATRYVGQSISDLVLAQEREHELAALKDQFIVDANHELRTPIMALYNNLELLAALSARGTAEQRTRILQRALASGDAVLRLLHSVLDTAALEGKPPRLELKAVTLAPLIRAILETFDPSEIGEPTLPTGAYEARAVSMHVPSDLVVWADEGRLRQILVNLLANALKYSAPGTPIDLRADAHDPAHGERQRARAGAGSQQPSAKLIQISVRDRGLGVPARDIPKLFNRFVRLERDIAGPVRGTGVGLYMCRVLIEAMGGRIWVESSGIAGEGSTFAFVLPVAPQESTVDSQRTVDSVGPSRIVAN